MTCRLTLCAVILFAFSTCQTPAGDQQQVALKSNFETTAPAAYSYGFHEPPGDDSAAADFAAFRTAFSLIQLFDEKGGVSTADAIETIRGVLSEKEERQRAIAAQATAMMLLDHHLADGILSSTSTDELARKNIDVHDQELVAFAIDLLVESRNPNADLIAAAISTLDGYWMDNRMRSTAASAERAAREAVEQSLECTDCGITGATRDRMGQIKEGIAQLRRLSAV